MAKIAIIKQPAGLGDILFTSKIRKVLEEDGYKVIHPVIKEYSWLSDYIEGSFPVVDGFEYVDLLNSVGLHPTVYQDSGVEIQVIPLQTADQLYPGSVMDAKYKLMNLHQDDWSSYLHFNRRGDRENALFSLLGLDDNAEFVLVNNKFGSPPNFATKNIVPNTDYKIINMDFQEGFTMFDWLKVMEKAKELHVIESSINYLLEKENIAPNKVFIYSKHTPPSFYHVQHLFTKNWNYIYQ